MDLLERVTRRAGRTLVLATHSAAIAARADRVLAIEEGRLVASRAQAVPPDAGSHAPPHRPARPRPAAPPHRPHGPGRRPRGGRRDRHRHRERRRAPRLREEHGSDRGARDARGARRPLGTARGPSRPRAARGRRRGGGSRGRRDGDRARSRPAAPPAPRRGSALRRPVPRPPRRRLQDPPRSRPLPRRRPRGRSSAPGSLVATVWASAARCDSRCKTGSRRSRSRASCIREARTTGAAIDGLVLMDVGAAQRLLGHDGPAHPPRPRRLRVAGGGAVGACSPRGRASPGPRSGATPSASSPPRSRSTSGRSACSRSSWACS